MPAITRDQITALTPAIKQVAGDEFAWVDKINKVISNISSLMSQMQQLQGKGNTTQPHMQNVSTTPAPVPQRSNMDKLKLYLIMFLTSLQQDGRGDTPIGQVIAAMPNTVNEVLSYVKKL